MIYVKHIRDIPLKIKNRFFCAITRCSTNIALVLNEEQLLACREIDRYSVSENANCCLQDFSKDQFTKLLEIVGNTPSEKPTILFVGKKPEVSLFTESRNYGSTEVPKIEGISLFQTEISQVFHVEDIFQESHLEILQNYGIRLIIIAPDSVSCHWSNIFYTSSSKLIEMYCKKRSPSFLPANIGTLGTLNKLVDFQKVLNFCYANGGYTERNYLGRLIDFQALPFPEKNILNWFDWIQKGDEFYRLGRQLEAAFMYEIGCLKLQNERMSENFEKKLRSHRRIYKIFMAFAELQDERDHGVVCQHFDGLTSQFCLMVLLYHAIQLFMLNFRCHSYCDEAIVKLQKFYEGRRTDFAKDTVFKKGSLDVRCHLWWKPNFELSDYDASFETKLGDFNSLIDKYRSLHNLKTDQTLEKMKILRNQISDFGAKLSEESLDLITARSLETPESNVDFQQGMKNDVLDIYFYPLQLALEALQWNPSSEKGYQVFLAALKKVQENLKCLICTSQAQESNFSEEHFEIDSEFSRRRFSPLLYSCGIFENPIIQLSPLQTISINFT